VLDPSRFLLGARPTDRGVPDPRSETPESVPVTSARSVAARLPDEHVRSALSRYNVAWDKRHDAASAEALQQSRLDLLLALAQEDVPLAPALLAQAELDAQIVLGLPSLTSSGAHEA